MQCAQYSMLLSQRISDKQFVQSWPSFKAQDWVLENGIFIPGLSKDTHDDRQAI